MEPQYETIEVDGIGPVEIEAGASPEAIKAVIQKLHASEDSPLATGRNFLSGMWDQGKEMVGPLLQIPAAIKDVTANMGGSPEARAATASGAREGVLQGVRGLKDLAADPIMAVTGAAPPSRNEPMAKRVGRLATVAGTMLLPGAVKTGARAVRGTRATSILSDTDRAVANGLGTIPGPSPEEIARVANGLGPPPGRVVSRSTPSVNETILDALYQLRADGPIGRVDLEDSFPRGGGFTTPPATETSVPMTVNPNAGGRLTPGSGGPKSLEDTLTGILAEAKGVPTNDPAMTSTLGPPHEVIVPPSGTASALESRMRAAAQGREVAPSYPQMGGKLGLGAGSGPIESVRYPKPTVVEDVPVEQSMPGMNDVEMLKAQVDQAGPQPEPTMGEMRNSSGADRTARDPRVQDAFKEVGIPATPDAVRDMTGEPSRRPMEAQNADLDNAFRRLITDERGSAQIGPSWDDLKKTFGLEEGGTLHRLMTDETGGVPMDVLKGAGNIANQLRVASMLSGTALPKSILGNLGAFGTAAGETGSIRPITEMFRFPTNAREARDAWRGGSNPAAIAGSGRINIPGRAMGALDTMTQKALERAGLSPDEAQRILLTRQNRAAHDLKMDSPVGRFMWPFQKTPFNQLAEGISPENWSTKKRAAMTVGAAGAGNVMGDETSDPRILALAAAFMGPRGLPFLMGAGFSKAGRNAVSGLSPIPEWGFPTDTDDLIRMTGIDPAFNRAFGPAKGGRQERSSGNNRNNKRGSR